MATARTKKEAIEPQPVEEDVAVIMETPQSYSKDEPIPAPNSSLSREYKGT